MLFTGWEVRTGKIFCRGLKRSQRSQKVSKGKIFCRGRKNILSRSQNILSKAKGRF